MILAQLKHRKLKNKGFAVSGVLYPILILTLFLIVQILSMMASRKSVLDKNKKQLLDSVNASNKIYTAEELSILVGEQKSLIDQLSSKVTTLESANQTLKGQVSALESKDKTIDTSINQLTLAADKMRHYTKFMNGSASTAILKFENNSRGAIFIIGSANGLNTQTYIRFEALTPSSPSTSVNNQADGKISTKSITCTDTTCTLELYMPSTWGYFMALSSSKFL